MEKTALVVVDGQNDFLDVRGTLLVHDAASEARKLARATFEYPELWDGIFLTQDSHYEFDIAHPSFWTDNTQGPVKPFTKITADSVRRGQYTPVNTNGVEYSTDKELLYVLRYLDYIESKGMTHTVWQTHCVMGTWGHKIHPILKQMTNIWSNTRDKEVMTVLKGQNPNTEHFSAFEAIMPNSDPRTQLNETFVDELRGYETIVWCGWAGSHCLPATMLDGMKYLPYQNHIGLSDVSAPVAGCKMEHVKFFNEATKAGARITPLHNHIRTAL